MLRILCFGTTLFRSTVALKHPPRLAMAAAAGGSHTALDEVDAKGAFKRVDSAFRNSIGQGDFPAAAGRYHLYVSYACPWAHRALMVRQLKGLNEVIGVSVVHPTWQRTKPEQEEDSHCGWVFRSPDDEPVTQAAGHGSFPCADCVSDTVNGCATVRDLYELAADTLGKYSVPILWDKEKKTIVNNESSEIIRMLNSAFNSLATNPDLDLYPEDTRADIDAVNEWIYPNINNGVYRCGFAKSQEAYDVAVEGLYSSLERVEEILSTQRFIAGEYLTEADVRLFVTLVRFDEVYVVYFKVQYDSW